MSGQVGERDWRQAEGFAVLPERVGLGKESLCVQLNAGGVEEKISFDRLLVGAGPESARRGG
jgi:hypothetical protein